MGEWLVSLPTQGSIIGLRDTDGDGTADQTRTVLSGLRCPYGLAIRDDTLFVAQSTSIARFNHLWGEGTPVPSGMVVDGLPDSGCGAHHFRPLAIDPAGALYIAFGSSCNVCVEADTRRSTVWKYAFDGTGREFARGLRNVVDLSFDPASGMLWAATNERDALGDDIPPEPVTPVNEGADYGWPYCYWNGDSWQVDARVPSRNPRCEGLTRYFGVQAHSAPGNHVSHRHGPTGNVPRERVRLLPRVMEPQHCHWVQGCTGHNQRRTTSGFRGFRDWLEPRSARPRRCLGATS